MRRRKSRSGLARSLQPCLLGDRLRADASQEYECCFIVALQISTLKLFIGNMQLFINFALATGSIRAEKTHEQLTCAQRFSATGPVAPYRRISQAGAK